MILLPLKNEADQATYNTEKQLNEHKEKIPQNIHDQINGDITALNEAVTTEDADKIREALERLKNSSMEIGKAIYSQTNTDQGETQQEEQPKEEEKAEETEEEKKKREEDEKKKD